MAVVVIRSRGVVAMLRLAPRLDMPGLADRLRVAAIVPIGTKTETVLEPGHDRCVVVRRVDGGLNQVRHLA